MTAPGPDEPSLHDPDAMSRIDTRGVLRELAAAGASVRRAAAAVGESELRQLAGDLPPRSVIIATAGTGGSGQLVADGLCSVIGQQAPAPVVRVRASAGRPPPWVGAADVILALDDPTAGPDLALAEFASAAASRGAYVVGIGDAGSPLAAALASQRAAVIEMAARPAWPAAYWPSVAAGYEALGQLVPGDGGGLSALADCLDEVAVAARPAAEEFLSPVKQIARGLTEATPVVWAASPVAVTAARRFASSAMAGFGMPVAVSTADVRLLGSPWAPGPSYDIFTDPEEVSGPHRQAHVVVLADPAEHSSVAAAVRAAGAYRVQVSLLDGEAADVPTSPLLRLGRWVGELDFVVAYTAIALGVDPGRGPDAAVGGPRSRRE